MDDILDIIGNKKGNKEGNKKAPIIKKFVK